MFSLSKLPSTTTILSAYSSFTAFMMLLRAIMNEAWSVVNQIIPEERLRKILAKLGCLYRYPTSDLTLIIHEQNGYMTNEMFEASEVYLRTKAANPSLEKLIVSKQQREKNLTITVEKDQDIVDIFEGIQVKWILTSIEKESGQNVKFFELSFHKQYKEKVIGTYLPYLLKRSKAITEENRMLKLYSLGIYGDSDDSSGGVWGSINLEHPSTFDTLAMDTNLKKQVLEDLDRFVKRREFYKRVGKPWKRGYLLYGPPGTGKSSLIAAMANYLNFNIYDLELTSVYSNAELRRILVATRNRSILVIEDIDCSVELKDRTSEKGGNGGDQFTLSGLLNFIDGLWSSCGDERIIIFTTNYKDRLDPALLRPGRMDMHIHMSYCTPCGFKLLASNYLQIQNHPLFEEIELLMKNVNVTPAEVAEELMKSDDAKTSLEGLINFLQRKKTDLDESNAKVAIDCETTNQKQEEGEKTGKGNKKKTRKTRKTRRTKILDYDDN
ncbi:Aaa-atpase [Thalictrum thalictroides]|uniref:Aaa-atpase n=1 Tax=Thalictrum thalictroides TaxID=46969 RepID=A0A7J6X184_THATH|nr:Aaa-atpase [Thalictrum thalictroides]